MSIIGISDKIILGKLNKTTAGFETYEIFDRITSYNVCYTKLLREWAISLGANVSLHFLDIPTEERRKRVHIRNKEKGLTFAFEVNYRTISLSNRNNFV